MPVYQLSIDAQSDLDRILQYTFGRFGTPQMTKYNDQLKLCFEEISKDNGLYKELESRGVKIRVLHCRKHYVFAVKDDSESVLY